MPLTYTPEVFFAKCTETHGGLYDYSDSRFTGSNNKISVRCLTHGVFTLRAKDHMGVRGCPSCSKIKGHESKRKGLRKFIEQATRLHGSKYTYHNTEYLNNYTPVKIGCRVHGDFKQTPSCHLKSQEGCPTCRKELYHLPNLQKLLDDNFNGRIRFADIRGPNSTEKFEFTCKTHGVFRRKISLTVKTGCTACNRAEELRVKTNRFIERAAEIHEGGYTYEKVVPTKDNCKVTVTCPTHGGFKCLMSNHVKGSGCPKCTTHQPISREELTIRSEKTHGNKYSYDKVPETLYVTDRIDILCRKHGVFNQRGSAHIRGTGCPACAKHGFKSHATGFLYVIPDIKNTIVKIGITNDPKTRIPTVLRPLNFKCGTPVVYLYPKNSIPVRKLEKELHRMLDSCGFTGFDGATEWYKINNEARLKSLHDLILTTGGIRA